MSKQATAAGSTAAEGQCRQPDDVKDTLNGLPNCTLITQEGEARVWDCASFCGRPCIIKESCSRPHRHDRFRRKQPAGSRLKQEVRSMCRLRRLGLRVPSLYHVEPGSSCIYMERVAGTPLRQLLADSSRDDPGLRSMLAAVGKLLAVMHDSGVVHGDLTASKLLLQQQQEGEPSVVLLDLGLSISSSYPEDKGVDLLLLLQDMTQKQQQQQQGADAGDGEGSAAQQDDAGVEAFDLMLDSYKKSSKQWSATFNKFAEARTKARQSSKKAALAADS